jgi:hypothetical protein
VTRFFGDATSVLFCPSAAALPPPADQQSLLTDAIVRGPILSLQLAETVGRAEESLSADPDEAAALFDEAAQRLEESSFSAHAMRLREAQARALRRAGRIDREVLIRLDMGWRQIRAGDPLSARFTLQALLSDNPDVKPSAQQSLVALQAALVIRSEVAHPLDQLAAAVDALQADDPHLSDAALLLAEHAVVAREPHWVVNRHERLESIAAALPHTDEKQLIAARFRMCIADATGTWDALASTSRETYPAGISALVTARHGRYLALSPNPDASVERWKLAIERGCPERLNFDVADWLYALRTTQLLHGLPLQDANEAHRLAQVLRSEGSGSLLPEPYPAKERGLDRMREGKWREAYQALLEYLWRSVVIADFLGELDAHELLGDLFAATGQGGLAMRHYVRSGEAEKLEQLAKRLNDQRIDVPMELLTELPWERRALYAFVTACADLVADDAARHWAAVAFEQLKATHQVTALGAPDPWLASCELFSTLAGLSSGEDAQAFVQIADAWVEREPGRYRFSDVPHVRALLNIARAHVQLSALCISQLLRALLVDQRMATTLLDEGQDLLPANRKQVEDILSPEADKNVFAALGLAIAGADTAPSEALARRFLEEAIAPRVHQPGTIGIGTNFSLVAVLVLGLEPEDARKFAEAMYVVANDNHEHSQNRCDALLALASISDRLSEHARADLLERIWLLSLDSTGPEFPDGIDNPFNIVRVNLGNAPFAAAVIRAASALSTSDQDYANVRQRGLRVLSQADEVSANWVCQALAPFLDRMGPVPVDLMASHGNRWVRALASVAWARQADRDPDVGARLAQDRSVEVRRTLASALAPTPTDFVEVVEILKHDVRRSVRRALLAH